MPPSWHGGPTEASLLLANVVYVASSEEGLMRFCVMKATTDASVICSMTPSSWVVVSFHLSLVIGIPVALDSLEIHNHSQDDGRVSSLPPLCFHEKWNCLWWPGWWGVVRGRNVCSKLKIFKCDHFYTKAPKQVETLTKTVNLKFGVDWNTEGTYMLIRVSLAEAWSFHESSVVLYQKLTWIDQETCHFGVCKSPVQRLIDNLKAARLVWLSWKGGCTFKRWCCIAIFSASLLANQNCPWVYAKAGRRVQLSGGSGGPFVPRCRNLLFLRNLS